MRVRPLAPQLPFLRGGSLLRRSRVAFQNVAQPRPTYGIVVAITVMNCTLASSGKPAM